MLVELVKERAKTIKAEIQVEAATQGMKEMAVHAKEKIQEAREETTFWKDRYVKLAWLANQALMDIPRSLRAAKGMTNLLNTPPEIMQFLELCRGLYNSLKNMSSPP
ncbi:hypothetical protein CR513_12350, partial [Mucuna pruriens]